MFTPPSFTRNTCYLGSANTHVDAQRVKIRVARVTVPRRRHRSILLSCPQRRRCERPSNSLEEARWSDMRYTDEDARLKRQCGRSGPCLRFPQRHSPRSQRGVVRFPVSSPQEKAVLSQRLRNGGSAGVRAAPSGKNKKRTVAHQRSIPFLFFLYGLATL